MAERETVINNKPLDYEGLFSVSELYDAIERWFQDNGYNSREIRHDEKVQEHGKSIFRLIEAEKTLKEYMQRIIVIKIRLEDIKEVTVKKDGTPIRLNQGKVDIKIDGFLQTDLQDRWEMKPGYFVIKTIIDKYITSPFTKGPAGGVAKDALALHARLKAFLNLYRY